MKSKKLLLFAFRLAVVAALTSLATLPLAAQGARDQQGDADQDTHRGNTPHHPSFEWDPLHSDRALKGTYFFTGEQACLVSTLGFNPNLTPVAGTGSSVSVQSASTQGIVKFNADGTGTAEFKELLIVHPPASPLFATSQQATFSFTYTIGHDGVLTFVFGLVSGKFSTGPLAGVSFTNNPPPMSGRIARNGTAIALTTVDPTVETANLGPPLNSTIPRICHRARTLIPIHVDEED
jgi:hypothetical protein